MMERNHEGIENASLFIKKIYKLTQFGLIFTDISKSEIRREKSIMKREKMKKLSKI